MGVRTKVLEEAAMFSSDIAIYYISETHTHQTGECVTEL